MSGSRIICLLIGFCAYHLVFSGGCSAATSGNAYKIQLVVNGHRNASGIWEKDVKLNYNGSEPPIDWKVDFVDTSGPDEYSFTVVGVVQAGPFPSYNLTRYLFGTEAQNWTTAKRICETDFGGYLAVINSQEESQALAYLFNEYPSISGSGNDKFAYIGFNDMQQEGYYVTVLGPTVAQAGFAQWAKGEPSNYHYPVNGQMLDEDCGCINRDGLLNDMLCTIKLGYICEKGDEIIPTTTTPAATTTAPPPPPTGTTTAPTPPPTGTTAGVSTTTTKTKATTTTRATTTPSIPHATPEP